MRFELARNTGNRKISSLALVYLFILLIALVQGCGDSRYDGLSEPQKLAKYEENKLKVLSRFVCIMMREELEVYNTAKKNNRFRLGEDYFPAYPLQFHLVQDFMKKEVRSLLRDLGVPSENMDFSNIHAPNILDLPCQDVIEQRQAAKAELKAHLRKMINE